MTTTEPETTAPPMPPFCPAWCTTNHLGVWQESHPDHIDIHDVWTHRADGGEQFLPELRSPCGRIMRDSDHRWDIEIRQAQRPENSGFESDPLLELLVEDLGLSNRLGIIHLTSGEARVLARCLTVAADRVDLPEVTR